MIGAAIVSMTSAGTGVGPGVIRYFFCIVSLSLFKRTNAVPSPGIDGWKTGC